ncbi:hypothetical protein Ancab_034805 [Ancistrocladus abbreviatus]
MKHSAACVAMCLAVVAVVLLGEAALTVNAATCNPTALSPCAGALTSGSPPSAACCGALRAQQPCLCTYYKNPSYRKYFTSPAGQMVARVCRGYDATSEEVLRVISHEKDFSSDSMIFQRHIHSSTVPYVDAKVASTHLLPALVTLGSDQNLNVKYASIDAFESTVDKIRVQMDAFLEDGSQGATVAVVRALVVAVPHTTEKLRDYILLLTFKMLYLQTATALAETCYLAAPNVVMNYHHLHFVLDLMRFDNLATKGDVNFLDIFPAINSLLSPMSLERLWESNDQPPRSLSPGCSVDFHSSFSLHPDLPAASVREYLLPAIQNPLKDYNALDPAHKEALDIIMKERSGGTFDTLSKLMGARLGIASSVSCLFGKGGLLGKKDTTDTPVEPNELPSPTPPPLPPAEDTSFRRIMRGSFTEMFLGKSRSPDDPTQNQ